MEEGTRAGRVDGMHEMAWQLFADRFPPAPPRLDRIEHLLLAEQKREIEDLQQRMRRLEDALAV